MIKAKFGPAAILLSLLGACGSTSPHRVDPPHGDCSPGEEMEREVTSECGNQHCTCTSAGEWRCISPPCTPTVGVPPCTPGVEFVDEVKSQGQLCRRSCVCRHPEPSECGEFECAGLDAGVSGAGLATSAPDQDMPEPCRALKCPAPERLDFAHEGEDAIARCVSADGAQSSIRRRCFADGHWEETTLEGGGDIEVHSLFAQGRSWQKSFSFAGARVLSCVPVPAPPNSLDCEVTGAPIVSPECWKKARLPRNQVRVLSSAAQLAKFVPCAPADLVDWSHTRVVLLRQEVSQREKLVLKVHPFDDRTDVVALVEKRCESHLRHNQPKKRKPAIRDLQVLIPLPYDGTELKARIEHSDGYCAGRP